MATNDTHGDNRANGRGTYSRARLVDLTGPA